MKEITLFRPELEVSHSTTFEVPQILGVTSGDITKFGDKIPAGVLLASAGTGHILVNPTSKAIVAAPDKAQGVLAHDIQLNGAGDYACGVIISGVVYKDIVDKANGGATTALNVTALEKQGCLIYNQITVK